MKINYKILLFICICVILIIIGSIYVNNSNTYIVEQYADSIINPYTRALNYMNYLPDEGKVYNTHVLKSNLPAIYDVDTKLVNLCYGNGNTSIYYYPYIILILRAYELLQSNNKSQEYNDILTILSTSTAYVSNVNTRKSTSKNTATSTFLNNEYQFITKNAENVVELETRTGANMFKTCRRLYPKWFKNPTETSKTQLNPPQNVFVNDSTISSTYNNPANFATLTTNTQPNASLLELTDTTPPIIQPVISSSSKTKSPDLEPVIQNILPSGSLDKSYTFDIDNFRNANSEFCSEEWTYELALENNISNSIQDKDICLKLLLNPLTGAIIQSSFVGFDSKTLTFNTNNIPEYVYYNMVTLIQTNTDEKFKTFGVQATQFNSTPYVTSTAATSAATTTTNSTARTLPVKLDKYVFDNCGRLYAVPTSTSASGNVSTYKFNGQNFDITQIYADRLDDGDSDLAIKTVTSLLTGTPLPAYSVISSEAISSISKILIDNANNLANLYTATIHNQFNSKYFDPTTASTHTKPNTFSMYFMNTNNPNKDPFYNIINYTSSDGYIYINLGQIKDDMTTAIKEKIEGGVTDFILSNFRSILLKQINKNVEIVEKNTTKLQSLQTQLYNIMNTVVTVVPLINNILQGKNGSRQLNIPLLTTDQISSLQNITNKNGAGNKNDYIATQSLLYSTSKNMSGITYLNIDPNNYLSAIVGKFNSLIGTTSKTVASLFTQQNMNTLIETNRQFPKICYDNVISNRPIFRYGNNLFTAKFILNLVMNSLVSIIYFKINSATAVANKIIYQDLPYQFVMLIYYIQAFNKWWRDLLDFLATGYQDELRARGQQQASSANNPFAAIGSSMGSSIPSMTNVLNSKATATAANVPGLKNTVTNATSPSLLATDITKNLKKIANTDTIIIPNTNNTFGQALTIITTSFTNIYSPNT